MRSVDRTFPEYTPKMGVFEAEQFAYEMPQPVPRLAR